jgi:hypothetical protein
MVRHVADQPYNGRAKLLVLPTPTIQEVKLDLTAEERALYDLMFAHAVARYRRFKDQGVAVARCIECIQMLLPVRQALSYGRLFEPDVRAQIERELAADLLRHQETQARHSLQVESTWRSVELEVAPRAAFQTLESDCSICLDQLDDAIQTACGHLFCSLCIRTYLDTIRRKQCPLCRQEICATGLYRPRVEESADAKKKRKREEEVIEDEVPAAPAPPSADVSGSIVEFRSKIQHVLDFVVCQSEGQKTLVFTQFVSTLQYLKGELAKLRVPFACIEGNMTMPVRKRNIERFQNDPSCRVFVLSVRAGAVGLTLTAAQTIFMVDPCLNPALEAQAIGRVVRLGQTQDVAVHHLVMRGTVEEHCRRVTRFKADHKSEPPAPVVPSIPHRVNARWRRSRPQFAGGSVGAPLVAAVQSSATSIAPKSLRMEELDMLFGVGAQQQPQQPPSVPAQSQREELPLPPLDAFMLPIQAFEQMAPRAIEYELVE